MRGCYELAILKEKSSLYQFMPVAKFHTVSLKEKKRVAQSLSSLSVRVFLDTVLRIIFKMNVTLVQVHVAIRNTRYFFHFILVHFDLDYPIDFGP